MTPQKKAKEIFDKMISKVNDNVIIEFFDIELWKDTFKKCALIAVDEIIEQTPEFIPEETYIGDSCGVDYFINEMFEYWNNVKQEIEKL